MALSTLARPDALALADCPLVLIGYPPLLRGSVHLANCSGEKLKLKRAVVHLKDAPWGDPKQPLSLQVAARLAAGVAGHAPVSLAIAEETAPGSYHGEVLFEGLEQRREVVLQVLEHRAVSVRPARFEVYGSAGGSVKQPVVITNLGNVPFVLPKATPLTLGEDNAFNTLFHAAMSRRGSEGHHAALDAFAELLAQSEVESGSVSFEAAGQSLAPGQCLATQLAFGLPSKLSRRRSYTGVFTLGKVSCSVDIEVDGESGGTSPPPSPPARVKSAK